VSGLDLAINNARLVVTADDDRTLLHNASIGIKDGQIVEISTHALEAKQIFDATKKMITPGLINTHTHLAMTLFRGWAEGVNLQGFLELVWAAEGAVIDDPTAELGTTLGALESLLGGTTTTLDMYLFPEATHRGAVQAGLRHIAGPIFFDFAGLDGLEWPQRIEFAKRWPEILKKIGGPKVPGYLMPHATYTCTPEHLAEVAALAKSLDFSIHIHASENERENRDVEILYGKTPTQVLAASSILDNHVVFGHGVHLNSADIMTLSAHHGAVAHCPGSNLKLASGIADVTGYRQAGIDVGLGTDGCSSSNDLDMWIVMRLAAYLIAQTKGPEAASAEEIFRMATIGGAKALGISALVGSLEVGKRADLIALELDAPHLIPMHDPYAQLVFAAGRSDVCDVWVDGEQVIRSRRSTKIDYPKLRDAVIDRVGNLREKLK
jgi:5-methylthioadenosine/S-adenosylhomocysteine deaminase